MLEKVPAKHGEQDIDPLVMVYIPAGQYLHFLGLVDVTYVPSILQKSGSKNNNFQINQIKWLHAVDR
jgi:hypothetical protein